MKTTSLQGEPPTSYAVFLQETGVSPVTGWRWEKKGLLKTINILGRKYISREEIRRFNARAEAGEFSRVHKVGRKMADA